jgi:hypothetical protein
VTAPEACKKGHTTISSSNGARFRWWCRTCNYEKKRERLGKANGPRRSDPNYCRPGYVRNAKLRELVRRELERDEFLTLGEIAVRAGWMRTRGDGHALTGDACAVERALGLKETATYKNGKRYTSINQTCSEASAVAIARAIHIDPWEIGL